MNWSEIWKILHKLVSTAHDPNTWKVSKDGHPVGPVTKATFTSTDALMECTDGSGKVLLEAKPSASTHADVFVNGTLQPNARLVVAIKSQLPFKPLILVLTYKHIQVGGGIHDYRFDHPK